MKRFVTPKRGAFTLVELMVVMAVIAIMSAMTLGVVDAARRAARKDATEVLVEKINGAVIDQCETYATRRLSINYPTGLEADERAYVRVRALRDVMRMEMPECWDDVTAAPRSLNGVQLVDRPALSRSYLSQYNAGAATPEYEAAECLYLFVSTARPDMRRRFREEETGDADGDGFLEFQDAWGNPIKFLRWAPGLCETDYQIVVTTQVGGVYEMAPDEMAAASENDPDPLDILQVDYSIDVPSDSLGRPPRSWRLFPIVYSAGQDGIYDIVERSNAQGSVTGNPYYRNDGSGGYIPNPVGMAFDLDNLSVTDPGPANGELNHHDNIHSHRVNN